MLLTLTVGGCGGEDKKPPKDQTATGGSGGSGAGGSAGAHPTDSTSGGSPSSGDSDTNGSGGSSTTGGSGGSESLGGMGGEAGSATDAPLPGEAGYVDLEAYTFSAGPELEGLTTSSARLFYAFVQADDRVEDRPLFVFSGGIPNLSAGAIIPGPSSTGLFSVFGVNRASLSEHDLELGLEPNDASWTDMGSLLFLDGRQMGFSYSTLEDPQNDGARGAQFASNNFNNFVDAADIVRGLLRFLATHAELKDNPIVLVGQGYSSIRISLMLSYLLYPERLQEDGGGSYTDPALADEVLAHYEALYPAEDSIPASLASEQFGWQIHLQPKVGGDQEGISESLWCQPDTPEYLAAEELDEPCPPVSRDMLHLDKEAGWSLLLRQASRETLLDPAGFAASFFLDPDEVSGLPAADRSGAYRLGTMLAAEDLYPKAPDAWQHELGTLPDHDRYYLEDVEQLISGNGNYIEGNDPACIAFIENAQYVATFVTNARFDGRVRTEAVAATLEDCSGYTSNDILDSVTADSEPRGGVERPGWLSLEYNDSAEIGASTRTVRWPSYAESGHLVTVSEPAALKTDVREFLESAGLPTVD